ncbi:MAG TPA: ribonuclease H-like domain-containing protein [Candidatus Acidoferrum sp.]|jgi:hypothetical protein
MASLADRFSRLTALKPSRATSASGSFVRSAVRRAPEQEDALSQLVGAAISTNHYGEHVSVSNWYSTPEFVEASSNTLDLLCRSRDVELSKRTLAALSDPTKWLFLDTETTGLSGGTGTYAFLIGLAWWDSGGLQVEQLFMRDFHEEHSILHELSARLAERPVLVTFNGKSFDWPLLENRFTMTRAIKTPKIAAHLDLLHPSRALWKLRLGSVRLVELERHVLDAPRLGWHRDDDVLSSMIPQHYFDYIRGGPAEPLAAVIRHNQMDLRGLAAILGRIDGLLAAAERADEDVESLDLFGLSRFLHKRGERDRAHAACSQALDIGLPAEHRPKARRELAQHAKRRGDHDHAVSLWQELAADSGANSREEGEILDAIHACQELSMYYERRAKDLNRATEFICLALAKVKQLRSASRYAYVTPKLARIEEKLLNRAARLQHRIESKRERAESLPLLQRDATFPVARAAGAGVAVGKTGR